VGYVVAVGATLLSLVEGIDLYPSRKTVGGILFWRHKMVVGVVTRDGTLMF
jgi:hypothetical protein